MFIWVSLGDIGFQHPIILFPCELSHAHRHGKVDHLFAPLAPCVV